MMKTKVLAKKDPSGRGHALRQYSKKYHSEYQKRNVIYSEAMSVIHTKTGKEYMFFGEVTNCTNGDNDGQTMGLYSDRKKVFVREISEFKEKFKEA